MGLGYGIQITRDTLLKNVSDESWEKKAGSMYSEMGVMTSEDTFMELFTEVNDWQKKYLEVISMQNDLTPYEIETACKKLVHDMIWICTEIIEENAAEIARQEHPDTDE